MFQSRAQTHIQTHTGAISLLSNIVSLARVYFVWRFFLNVEFVWPRIAISLFDLYFVSVISIPFTASFGFLFLFCNYLRLFCWLVGCVRAFDSSSLYNFLTFLHVSSHFSLLTSHTRSHIHILAFKHFIRYLWT